LVYSHGQQLATADILEVSALEAWQPLSEQKDALLIDVRTQAEWAFIGAPTLNAIDKETYFISIRHYPNMAPNPDFVTQLQTVATDPDAPLYFICRSGARSLEAAKLAQQAGYTKCINIADGFEGNPNIHGHRGTDSGWKAAGLDWAQS